MSNWQNRLSNEIKLVPACDLLANPENARRHPAKQREALRGSLETLGWVAPVFVGKSGYLLDGHARVEEALSKDENTLIPVIEVDLEPHEEKLFLASFDYITYLAEYDRDSLDNLLKDVQTDEPRLQMLLSGLAQDNDLYFGDKPEETEAPEPQIDRAEELNKQWQVKRGDLWIIPSASGNGEHRLLCGDSTNAGDVARLMGDDKAETVFTDPPYNVTDNKWDKFKHDDFLSFLETVVTSLVSIVSKNASLYLCLNWRYVAELKLLMDKHFKIINWIIWHHISRGAQFNFYTPSHQDILFYSNGDDYYFDATEDLEPYAESSIDRDKYNSVQYVLGRDGKSPSDVWYFPQVRGNAHENEPHPTQKPIELVCRAIRVSTPHNGLVYDPFGGSGTTMAACEQLNRQCRMIEIHPPYIAVILQRMSDMGLKPYLKESLTNGKTNETNF